MFKEVIEKKQLAMTAADPERSPPSSHAQCYIISDVYNAHEGIQRFELTSESTKTTFGSV